MQDLDQSIRERAYRLWMEGGYQDGQADVYWLAAQREILSTSLDQLGHVTVGAAAPSKKARTVRRKRRAAMGAT